LRTSAAAARKLWPVRPEVLAALGAALAAGCGPSGGGASTPLAARVNAESITVQELETARKRGENLEGLIDQRLARQDAVERGLDRAPQIAHALERARTEILARAYRQLIAEAQPRPTRQEVAQFYREHPELFAQRRIYSLEQITLTGGRELGAALHERAARGESLEAIARWLEPTQAPFTIHRSTRAAEELPLEVLPRLQAMKEGEVHVMNAGADGFVVLRVATARAAPLDEAASAPLIEKFLLARRSSEALASEMKRLRQQARIEYAEVK
jgi:EpsD family peptidyl-prolyl cis-trans isomerase